MISVQRLFFCRDNKPLICSLLPHPTPLSLSVLRTAQCSDSQRPCVDKFSAECLKRPVQGWTGRSGCHWRLFRRYHCKWCAYHKRRRRLRRPKSTAGETTELVTSVDRRDDTVFAHQSTLFLSLSQCFLYFGRWILFRQSFAVGCLISWQSVNQPTVLSGITRTQRERSLSLLLVYCSDRLKR